MPSCKTCIHSRDVAKADNVLACILIHRGDVDASKVTGDVFIGWYGKGRIFRGPVVSKNATCDDFKEEE